MARVRRQPAQAPVLVPCTPATWLPASWLPPGARVRGELSPDGAHARLVIALPDATGEAGEVVEVVLAVLGPCWATAWTAMLAQAWERHRLAAAQREALARDAASTPEVVSILDHRRGDR